MGGAAGHRVARRPERRQAERAGQAFGVFLGQQPQVAASRSRPAPASPAAARHRVERARPAWHGPSRSARAACGSRPSPRSAYGPRSSRAQAAVSVALPRVVVALRPSVTRLAERRRVEPGAMRELGQFRPAADARDQQPVARGPRPAGAARSPPARRRRSAPRCRPPAAAPCAAGRAMHEPGEAAAQASARRPAGQHAAASRVTASPHAGRASWQPPQPAAHGALRGERSRSRRRRAGSPGSASHSAGGRAPSAAGGRVAPAARPANGAARLRQRQQHRQRRDARPTTPPAPPAAWRGAAKRAAI